MKLIVGLGNTGKKYENIRHNTGFMVVDAFVSKIQKKEFSEKKPELSFKLFKEVQSFVLIYPKSGLKKPRLIIAKPQCLMNVSGLIVKKIITHFSISNPNLWVIHDDLDLPLGTYKIQKGIGPKLHYGLLSIERNLKTKDFWRVRVGIDNRVKDRVPGENYVLQKFLREEKEILDKTIDKLLLELSNILLK